MSLRATARSSTADWTDIIGEEIKTLGPADKPVLAPARSERRGRRDTHVAAAVTSWSADPMGKQRIKERRGGFRKDL